MFKRVIHCIGVVFLLTGCASQNPLTDMRFQTIVAPPHIVSSWYKIEKPGETLKVYIEEDGTPDNPNPVSTRVRKVAAADPFPNVVYLARPCQYLQTDRCTTACWTTGRYSTENIGSLDRSILSLMKKAQTDRVILIGVGGGAQVAGLIAIKHLDYIQKIVTVGGILDQKEWAKKQGIPPLTESLNLADFKEAFLTLPQIHFIGEKDSEASLEMAESFGIVKENIVVIPKKNHDNLLLSIQEDLFEIE